MPANHHTFSLVTFFAFTTVAAVALADVPPEPGYVEKCTVDKQQKSGEKCEMCGDAYHGEPEACAKKFAGSEHTKRCQTRGASTWDELWCAPVSQDKPAPSAGPTPSAAPTASAAPGPAPAAPTTPPASCSVVQPSQTGSNSGLAALALLLGASLLRRNRR